MTIKIKIVRGPAHVYADNKDKIIELNDGDSITIRKSENIGSLVVPKFEK